MSAACLNASLDGDLDVDTDDLALFLECFSGPHQPGNPACGG